MNVQQLIDELEKVEDKAVAVLIADAEQYGFYTLVDVENYDHGDLEEDERSVILWPA